MSTALLIVDVQNDFVEGSLALSNCPAKQNGADVIPIINNLVTNLKLSGFFEIVVYTQDWHPCDHCSFIDNIKIANIDPSKSSTNPNDYKTFDVVNLIYPCSGKTFSQTLWPIHCVQDTWGAELCKDLKVPDNLFCKNIRYLKKGCDKDIDCYSAFYSNDHFFKTDLDAILKDHSISNVFVCGLALDICVYHTTIDAKDLGYKTFLLQDACRGVDNQKIKKATLDMLSKDIIITNSWNISNE